MHPCAFDLEERVHFQLLQSRSVAHEVNLSSN